MATVSRTVTGIQIPVTEKYYKEVIEGASSYNARLCSERRLRLPFLDSQTGVAQNHTNLWVQHRFRTQGDGPGQLYTYPAKRWKKKKRTVPIGGELPVVKATEVETVEATPYMHNISAVENPAVVEVPLPPETKDLSAWKDEYYDEWENLSEPPDAGEIDDRNSDSSDFEQTYIKKRKKKATKKTVEKKPSSGRGRRSGRGQDLGEVDEVEKPYGCDRSSKKEKNKEVSKYCDFCLGDETENKKTGQKEELVSCADCGRSGHPSCLQFTANMIISVKKYPWQCIECKSCGLCGTSDNDDQLLFCDDCDRGYHMYCLNPPLSEPPEGSWSCHLCIVEFYDGKKPDNGQV